MIVLPIALMGWALAGAPNAHEQGSTWWIVLLAACAVDWLRFVFFEPTGGRDEQL